MKNSNKIETGRIGEELAIAHLKKQGYRIIECNYRCKLGEVDIIARDKNVLCFIEVKSRSSNFFGAPEDAVSRVKQRKISQVVLYYLKTHKLDTQDYRFDVVSVMLGDAGQENKVEIIQDAFPLDQQYFC